jgi:hypothetical protein
MQSDVLPFTLYDTMDYSSVNDMEPPSGFARRDAPQVQTRQDGPPPIQPHPQLGHGQQGQSQQGPGQAQPTQAPKTGNDEVLRQIMVGDEGVNLGEEYVKPKGPDIGNYMTTSDLLYILVAVLFVDVFVIFLVRFAPDIFGQSINRWYDLFGLNAVIADVLIIVIGFVIARYIYTLWVKPKYGEGKWSPLQFTGVAVAVQFIHDLAFYFGIITQVPRGQNMMIDVFKDYSEGGAKILFADGAMMVGSSLLAMGLKSQPVHIVAAFSLVVSYILPYLLYQKNKFSVLK